MTNPTSPLAKKTQELVDAYYESWIATKSINTEALERVLAPSMKYNGPIDTNDSRAEFLPGLAEFAYVSGGVRFQSRLYGESEAYTSYDARVEPLGEDIRIFERFSIEDGMISQIDLVFDSIKLRPLIEAARAAAQTKRVVVRYKVSADKIEENAAAVRKVFAELTEKEPSGLSYTSMSSSDGTFVHVAEVVGENPLQSSAAFKEFQAGLKDRCEEPPQALEVGVVGTYSSNS